MLLRDIPVATPELIGPTDNASDVREIEVQKALQAVATTEVAERQPITVPDLSSASGFYSDALKSYYEQTGSRPTASPQPQPDPQPEPQPQPEPETPGTSTPLPLRTDTLTAEAGRVLTIEPADSGIASIKILSQTSHGYVSVNPDNSLSLVLSEDPDDTSDTSFSYEITYESGRTQKVQANVDVTAGSEPDGWGKGQFYVLETGTDGRMVIEHGENHRKIYVTEGAHGLTRAEIAKAEGLAESKINASWLKSHPEYGATPDKALDSSLGMELWYAVTGRNIAPNSNWLLLERGYEYENLGRIVDRGTQGESALNPTLIGAYGEGNDPKINGGVTIFQDKSSHVVLQGLDITGVSALGGENILFDRMSISKSQATFKGILGFTLRDSDITDVAHNEPKANNGTWASSENRTSGVYMAGVDGAYLDNNLFDRNGWAPGYDYNMSPSKPMPPSMYNHNLYVQFGTLDITVRDNIFLRGASFGAQVRPGGLIEGNTFIDNNAALNFFSSSSYTLALDNLVTSAGYKTVSDFQGAVSYGIDGNGRHLALIENIIAHFADPNNPAEQAIKRNAQLALVNNDREYFDDTIVYNWSRGEKIPSTNVDRNIDGLSKTVLDQTTIQNFTAELLGKKTATISDLGNYLRAQADGKLDHVVDADVINAFFRKGFGFDTTLRDEAETLRFVLPTG